MAEDVNYSLEETIPELETMVETGMFEMDEIKPITVKREKMLYRLSRIRKRVSDFKSYIDFETDLLNDIRRRRKDMEVTSYVNEIDYSISRRIRKFFHIATALFSGDVALWVAYVDFCKSVGLKATLSRVIDDMLRVHMHRPELWLKAATIEFETNDSPGRARQLYLRAIALNPEAKELYHTYFRMELQYCQDVIERREVLGLDEDAADAIVQGKVAEIVFFEAVQKHTDAAFISQFASICEEIPVAAELREKVLSHLKEKCPPSNEDSLLKELEELADKKDWEKLERVLLRAGKTITLPAKYFLIWVSTPALVESREKTEQILELAVTKHPTDAELWTKYYEWACFGDNSTIASIIDRAIDNLDPKQALLFWEYGLQRCIGSKSKREKWYKQALLVGPHVSRGLKSKYLRLVYENDGIEEARKLFRTACNQPPISATFFDTMADIEKENMAPILNLRRIYESALRLSNLRHSERDLWIDYVLLEMRYPGGCPILASKVHERAMLELPDALGFVNALELAKSEK